MNIRDLRIRLFADGADRRTMLEMADNPMIRGFTTNPTLMRKAGIADYEAFARDILRAIPDRPISFEVFADDFDQMEEQASQIATWGDQVYVKVPVTNTKGESSAPLISRLSGWGVKVNATALMTLDQVSEMTYALAGGAPGYISVFAGRLTDTGRDPVPFMRSAIDIIRPFRNIELIWASPRELLNVFQADQLGCHIITATSDILKKIELVERDLAEYSLETVKMFYDDARKSGFTLNRPVHAPVAAVASSA
jgi:transaldolase